MKFFLLLTVAVALRGVRAAVRWCSNAAETSTSVVQDTALRAGIDRINDRIDAAKRTEQALRSALQAAANRVDDLYLDKPKALDAVLKQAVKA